jgi:hypothetical protein
LKKIFRLLAELLGQSKEKYYDYLIFNFVDYGLIRSGAHRRALAQNYRQRSGARHQLAPECGSSSSALKTYDFVDISNATIPTALGGSTTTSPPIVVVIP